MKGLKKDTKKASRKKKIAAKEENCGIPKKRKKKIRKKKRKERKKERKKEIVFVFISEKVLK